MILISLGHPRNEFLHKNIYAAGGGEYKHEKVLS
jgi:hypothetical protein